MSQDHFPPGEGRDAMAEEPEPQSPPTATEGTPSSFVPPTVQPGSAPIERGSNPTIARPTHPIAVPAAPREDRPSPGQRFGDFLLIEELGAGAFAVVFLAEQVSLGRQVALKIARASGDEARTLATLEHEFIVPVYAEMVDSERRLRLLCMKFVPGTTLERVMRELSKSPREVWSGQAILDAIDGAARHKAMFDLAALRDRQRLAESDFVEAVCWLGARVAEALAHAHSRGVLHRDIKPANILMNNYGRPLLSDFNLALNTQRGKEDENFGGTLRYMAPEHLAAFYFDSGASRSLVDERSDIYSLGVVLFELLTGSELSRLADQPRLTLELVDRLEQERREDPPLIREQHPGIPEVTERVVRRCLDPNPARRYQRAADLSLALDGCRQLQQWERDFPPALRLTRQALAAPILVFVLLGVVPHLLGSAVNIAYNTFAIISGLEQEQKDTFNLLLLGYNVLVYPLCIWLVCRVMVPVIGAWKRLAAGNPVDALEVAQQRRRALGVPTLVVAVSCLGWLPGGVLFPLGIDLLAGLGEQRQEVYLHFLVSFTVSGLIATTYSYFGMQVFVLRILYPRLWADPQHPRQQARQELGPIERRLRVFQFAAGLIPLSGAILMMTVSKEDQLRSLLFRLLVVGLIGLGMMGFGVALLASSRASSTLSVMLGRSVTRST